jgi:hypothetical protein
MPVTFVARRNEEITDIGPVSGLMGRLACCETSSVTFPRLLAVVNDRFTQSPLRGQCRFCLNTCAFTAHRLPDYPDRILSKKYEQAPDVEIHSIERGYYTQSRVRYQPLSTPDTSPFELNQFHRVGKK